MAPNRKSSNLFTSSAELESLKIPLQAKFLPLTDPREQQQQKQNQEHELKCYQHETTLVLDPKTEKSLPTVSYWDWTPDTIEAVKEAEEEEAVDDVFSTSRFESNLIADSMRREEDSSSSQLSVSEEQQSYWGWFNGYDVVVVETETETETETDSQADEPILNAEQHCEDCCESYWTWQEDEESVDACSKPSPSQYLRTVVTNSRKKYGRRHSHLPEATGTSDHYWHWSEFHSSSASAQ